MYILTTSKKINLFVNKQELLQAISYFPSVLLAEDFVAAFILLHFFYSDYFSILPVN